MPVENEGFRTKHGAEICSTKKACWLRQQHYYSRAFSVLSYLGYSIRYTAAWLRAVDVDEAEARQRIID